MPGRSKEPPRFRLYRDEDGPRARVSMRKAAAPRDGMTSDDIDDRTGWGAACRA